MELKKGYFYALPSDRGWSFGTYLGKVNGCPVFRSSDFAEDVCELSGTYENNGWLVEVCGFQPASSHEAFRLLMNKLDE